jgi:hypothetical protein
MGGHVGIRTLGSSLAAFELITDLAQALVGQLKHPLLGRAPVIGAAHIHHHQLTPVVRRVLDSEGRVPTTPVARGRAALKHLNLAFGVRCLLE